MAIAASKGAPEFRSDALRMASSDKAAPDAESGETYHLSAEQLKELNATGTVQCDEGCTITADIAPPDEAAAPDASAMEAGA